MIAENSLADIGKSRIDSLTDSPDSESDVILVLNGELAYTLVSTRTQVFIGNSFEDFIRFEATTMAGARQEMPDSSIVALSYLFSAIPTEVWADPYVVGQNRSKTDRTSPCLRLGYDKILGSDFEIRFAWRDIDRSGRRVQRSDAAGYATGQRKTVGPRGRQLRDRGRQSDCRPWQLQLRRTGDRTDHPRQTGISNKINGCPDAAAGSRSKIRNCQSAALLVP